jgi:leader peptidase (prepilin peptidase)/N-methyltransferase
LSLDPPGLLAEAAILLLAPIAGSAVGAFARRWPDDLADWARGRSRCPSCGTVLGWRDLVPLVSFLLLRGRCRHCRAPIDRAEFGVELAALVPAGLAVLLLPPLPALLVAAIGWMLLAAALVDRRTLLLPDLLTLPLGASGLVAAWAGLAPVSVLASLAGALLGFSATALIGELYRRLRGREGLGLGDAKLLAAAGAWLGPQRLPLVLLIGAASALLAALATGAHRRPEEPIPFGPWLALGFWSVALIAYVELNPAVP